MPIDEALDKMGKEDELKELRELKEKQEAELKQRRENELRLSEQLREYRERLEQAPETAQRENIRAHLRGLSNFWPSESPIDKEDEAVIRLVTHPDFVEVYGNALILKTPRDKAEYVSMRGLQLTVIDMAIDFTKFFTKLAPLGLNLTCPYFRCERNRSPENIRDIDPFDICIIDGKDIQTLCEGRYDDCVIFKDRTTKFSTGELPYQKPARTYRAPELLIDEENRYRLERKLLDEIEEFREGD